MNKSTYHGRVIAALLLVTLFAAGCGLSGRPVSVNITEIGVCQDYDEVTREPIGVSDRFSSVDQIMVYFYAETNLQADVTYRWWLDGELIAEYQAPLEKGYNFGWIGSEGNFPQGEYRVEILLGQVTLDSTSFQVVSP